MDTDETIRLDVVQAVIAIFKHDVSGIQPELQSKLLDIVKQRSLDKKVCEMTTGEKLKLSMFVFDVPKSLVMGNVVAEEVVCCSTISGRSRWSDWGSCTAAAS